MAVDLVRAISQASDIEIGALLTAVLQRYAELFPDWEISTVSLEKSADKNAQLDRIITTLQSMKTASD